MMKRYYYLLLLGALAYSPAAQAQYSMETYHRGYEDEEQDKRDGLTEIYFVGTGDLQFGYTNPTSTNKGIAANTGLGVLFWRIWRGGKELQLDAKINIASTVDTVSVEERNGLITSTRLFGRYALVPAGSGQATQINALFYFPRPSTLSNEYSTFSGGRKVKLFVSGIEFSGAASNQVWATFGKASGATHTLRSVNVSTLAWRLGVFHDFMPQDLGRQKGYAIRLGLNAIGRSLQGDIGMRTDAMQALRKDFLGGTNTGYWGGELLLALRLKNIRAEASLPYIFRRSGESIPGLTGAQFVTSISFVGGFPLSIGNANNAAKAPAGQ